MSSNFLLLFFVLVASLASNQAPPARQCILDMFPTHLLSQIVLPNVVIRKFTLPPVTLHLQEVGWSNNFSNLSECSDDLYTPSWVVPWLGTSCASWGQEMLWSGGSIQPWQINSFVVAEWLQAFLCGTVRGMWEGAHINSQMQLTSILDETWLGHVGCTSSINSGEASHLIPLLTVAAMVGSKLQVPSGTPVHRFTALWSLQFWFFVGGCELQPWCLWMSSVPALNSSMASWTWATADMWETPTCSCFSTSGKHKLKQVIQSSCDSDVFVGCSLVDMYVICWSMEDAQRVFIRCHHVMWSLGMPLYGDMWNLGKVRRHWNCFKKWNGNCVPWVCHFVGVLNAFASIFASEEAKCAHEQIIHQLVLQRIAWLACMQNVPIKVAWGVLNEMPWPDVNAVLGGCMGMVRKLLNILTRCVEGVQPNDTTFVWILSTCTDAGLVDEGMHCYGSLITVYMISANWNIWPAWSTFLALLAIYRRQRIWSMQCHVNRVWLHKDIA